MLRAGELSPCARGLHVSDELDPVEPVELDARYPERIRYLADAIHGVLGVQYAWDIGCGRGMLVARLRELGWQAVGLEGDLKAVAAAVEGSRVLGFDLRLHARVESRDVVICTEVAEHVDARWADRVVDQVCNAARAAIVWSAAPPGQEWPGHVNLQPPGYWLDKFFARGWEPDDGMTQRLRDLMALVHAQHCEARDNFWILRPRLA